MIRPEWDEGTDDGTCGETTPLTLLRGEFK